MQGEIKLGDRGVSISANASFLLVYLSEFGEDIFPDLVNLMTSSMAVIAAAVGFMADQTEESTIALSEMAARVDEEKCRRLIWALARNADPTLDSYSEWIRTYPELDTISAMIDVVKLLHPTLTSSIKSKQKSKKSAEGRITTHLIMVAITARGMTVSDMERFTIGQCVDFVVEWNNIHAPEGKEKREPVRVRAGQREWDSFGL